MGIAATRERPEDARRRLESAEAGHSRRMVALYHHESASRGAEDTPEKHERFAREVGYMLKRWGPQLQHDRAYNPNLTLEFTDFSLAAPPRSWQP